MGHPVKGIAMDLAGPFPMSRRGSGYILVMADYFRKWCEIYPVPTIDTPEIANVFVENSTSHYGVLLELHTNQGRKLWIKLALRDVQTVEDLQVQNNSIPFAVRWNGGTVQQDILITFTQGCWWASRRLGSLYSTFYVGLLTGACKRFRVVPQTYLVPLFHVGAITLPHVSHSKWTLSKVNYPTYLMCKKPTCNTSQTGNKKNNWVTFFWLVENYIHFVFKVRQGCDRVNEW